MTSPETMTTDQLLERMVAVLHFEGKPGEPVWHARAVGVFDFAHGDTPREAIILAVAMQDRQLAEKSTVKKPTAVATEPSDANADLF